jgi:hypothetical protein
VDRDGNLDLVVVNSTDNTLTVLRGNGLGAFGAPATVSTGTEPNDVVVADIDRDGRSDIAVGHYVANDSVVGLP